MIAVRNRRSPLILLVLPLALLGVFTAWVGWISADPGDFYPIPAGAAIGFALLGLSVQVFDFLFGVYEIELGRRDLKTRYVFFGFSRTRVYDLARVRRLRIENLPTAQIAFDFGPATVRFGISLGQPVSAEMLGELKRLFVERANDLAEPLPAGPREKRIEPPAPLHRSSSRDDRLLVSLRAQHLTGSAVIAAVGIYVLAFITLLLLAARNWLAFLPAAPAIFFALELAWHHWAYEEIEADREKLCHRACLLGYVKERCFTLESIASLYSGARIPVSHGRPQSWFQPFLGNQQGTLCCRVAGKTEKMLILLEEGETEMVIAEIKAWLEHRGCRLGAGPGEPQAGIK